MILPAIWSPSWKAAKVGEREFEPENVGVETWKGFYGWSTSPALTPPRN